MKVEFSPAALRAFLALVQFKKFGDAAKYLHISQPALSIQIRQMEENLGFKLFERLRRGVELNEKGLEVLAYAKAREQLEYGLVSRLSQQHRGLSGIVKIAGHYSIIKHVVVPALAELLLKNINLQLQTLIREDAELPNALLTGEADFVFLQYRMDRPNIDSKFLGHEEYVAVESLQRTERKNVFIDSDPRDTLVQRFYQFQKMQVPRHQRMYLHDENGILQGVELGLGRAIVAKNEIQPGSRVRKVKGLKPYLLEAHIHYFQGSMTSSVHKEVFSELVRHGKIILKNGQNSSHSLS